MHQSVIVLFYTPESGGKSEKLEKKRTFSETELDNADFYA
jgi:hypothetical protein